MLQRKLVLATVLLLILVSLAWLSIKLIQPPHPVPANAPLSKFSAMRAMQHVQTIAREPHAMGTPEHKKVRKYLLQEMEELGLSPQIQETAALNNKNGVASVGYVYNLIGRLPGNGNSNQAVLLMAHYDSQPNARGAGDDAAGVAAILETIRAIRQGASPNNDLIVLLTDGEEYGLYGAKAFMKHPWAKDVSLVINVEARGNRGPSMTFEFNQENGWIAEQFIKHAPYPFVSSLAYEIYSRMPNDTDFTVFKNAGYSGLNSAFIDGFVHYHKATDSPENLDKGSLQQHGSNMLALTQHFANTSLVETKSPDAIFFNFIGSLVILYPQWVNVILLVLTLLLLIAVIYIGLKKGFLLSRQVIIGAFAYLVILILIVVLFKPLNDFVLQMLPYTHRSSGVHRADDFFIAYILLASGMFILLSWLALRRLQLYSLYMGIVLLQGLLLVLLFLVIPNAAYFLMFPLLFSLIVILFALYLRVHKLEDTKLKLIMILLLGAVPVIFVLMPLVQIVFVAFGLQMPAGAILLFLLLLSLLLPLLIIIERGFALRGFPVLPTMLLLLGFGWLGKAVINERPSGKQPLHSHVSYYLNADTGEAYWASLYQTTDNWNKQFFGAASTNNLSAIYPHATMDYLLSKANPINISGPVAEVISDSTVYGKRFIELLLKSPREAAHLEIVLQPEVLEALQKLSLEGEELQLEPINAKGGKVFYTRLYGMPESKAVKLEIVMKPDVPFIFYLYDQSIGLPAELVKVPKPAYVVAEQGSTSNLLVVRKKYEF